MVTRPWVGRSGNGVLFLRKTEMFLFSTASRPALGPIQPRIKWVPGLSSDVKWPERKADHSPPSSVEVKNSEPIALYSLPHRFLWIHGASISIGTSLGLNFLTFLNNNNNNNN
jgi:hypothetical protein